MDIDLAQIAAIAKLASDARPLLKALREVKLTDRHQNAVNDLTDIVGEVSDRLFGIQTSLLALQQENATLKSQLAAAENWEGRREKYKLVKSPEGGILLESQEPFQHYACLRCAEADHELHPLQYNGEYSGSYNCKACGKSYDVHKAKPIY